MWQRTPRPSSSPKPSSEVGAATSEGAPLHLPPPQTPLPVPLLRSEEPLLLPDNRLPPLERVGWKTKMTNQRCKAHQVHMHTHAMYCKCACICACICACDTYAYTCMCISAWACTRARTQTRQITHRLLMSNSTCTHAIALIAYSYSCFSRHLLTPPITRGGTY